jgi:hypothetical protein
MEINDNSSSILQSKTVYRIKTSTGKEIAKLHARHRKFRKTQESIPFLFLLLKHGSCEQGVHPSHDPAQCKYQIHNMNTKIAV